MTRYPKVSQVVRHVVEPGRTMWRDFENAKIEDVSECRATARQRMVKRMVRQDLIASDRCRMRYPKVSQVVRDVTDAGTTVPWHFENAKIQDILEFRATAR